MQFKKLLFTIKEGEDVKKSSYITHGLSQSQRDQVIEVHNRLRKGERASDMHKLVSSIKLQTIFVF